MIPSVITTYFDEALIAETNQKNWHTCESECESMFTIVFIQFSLVYSYNANLKRVMELLNFKQRMHKSN